MFLDGVKADCISGSRNCKNKDPECAYPMPGVVLKTFVVNPKVG